MRKLKRRVEDRFSSDLSLEQKNFRVTHFHKFLEILEILEKCQFISYI